MRNPSGCLARPPHHPVPCHQVHCVINPSSTKTGVQPHRSQQAALPLGLSSSLSEVGMEQSGHGQLFSAGEEASGRRPLTRAWEGVLRLHLAAPPALAPQWQRRWALQLPAGAPRTHLARLWAMKGQPFKAGLDRSRVTRDREPCAPERKEASAWPPRGAELPGWEARPALGKGRRRGGKTELVFGAQGLKGGCVCPSGPRAGGDVSHWWPGGGAAQLPRTRGHNAHPRVNVCQCEFERGGGGAGALQGGLDARASLGEPHPASHPPNMTQARPGQAFLQVANAGNSFPGLFNRQDRRQCLPSPPLSCRENRPVPCS